jgi:uncharacterized protein
MSKSSSKFQSAYESDLRRYQEQHGSDATLDIIQDAARRKEADYLAFLANRVGLNRTEDGKTALFWLAGTNELEAVRLLVQHGASVQSAGKGAASPLMHAAYCNQLEMAKLLVAQGARVDFKDKNGDSALSFAQERGHGEMVAFLEQAMAKKP